MLNTRWIKILRDMQANKMRTVLVVLSIAIGILGVGSILSAYSILAREMNRSYLDTDPASATLFANNIDDELVEMIRSRPEIAEVEVRRRITGRVQIRPNEWRPIALFVIEDFDNIRVSTFSSERGAWNPKAGEILVERASLEVIEDEAGNAADVGDTLIVKIPNGMSTELTLTGVAYDPGVSPGWMEGWVYSYISPDTLALLGGDGVVGSGELRVVVAENELDEDYIRSTTYELRNWLETQGYSISRITVPPPGEHPQYNQLATLLIMLEVFGALSLLLSGTLVATMISAVMAQQLRQIGVMKAVGARTRQISGLYFSTVLLLSVVALVVGIPAGVLAGRLYAAFVADMLNFEIESYKVDYWVYLLQLVAGLGIPLLVAIGPIYKGNQYTVHESLTDYSGGKGAQFGTRLIDRVLGQIQGLGRPMTLSLRNTFRRQGRLLLTIFTLGVGGAIFMGSINMYRSWDQTIRKTFDNKYYDIDIWLSQPAEQSEIEDIIGAVPGVANLESWGQAQASLVYNGGTNSNLYDLLALPTDAKIMKFDMVEGRWLESGDTNAVVVNHTLQDEESDIVQVGKDITLNLSGQETTWTVVGMVREIGGKPAVYTSYDYFASLTDQQGLVSSIRVAVADGEEPDEVAKRVEQALADSGMDIYLLLELEESEEFFLNHIRVLLSFLIAMSVLVAAVGALGLASTMSINVMERIREIGVMRSIGATMNKIWQIVIVEGLSIGVLSWGVAIVVSLPITKGISTVSGEVFLQTALKPIYSFPGVGLWLGIVVLVSAIASLYPAWRASELTVNEILVFE